MEVEISPGDFDKIAKYVIEKALEITIVGVDVKPEELMIGIVVESFQDALNARVAELIYQGAKLDAESEKAKRELEALEQE